MKYSSYFCDKFPGTIYARYSTRILRSHNTLRGTVLTLVLRDWDSSLKLFESIVWTTAASASGEMSGAALRPTSG